MSDAHSVGIRLNIGTHGCGPQSEEEEFFITSVSVLCWKLNWPSLLALVDPKRKHKMNVQVCFHGVCLFFF